jgi:hypothetical protein
MRAPVDCTGLRNDAAHQQESWRAATGVRGGRMSDPSIRQIEVCATNLTLAAWLGR